MEAPKNHVFYRTQNWHYPKIIKGEGIYLIDEEGNQYIDGCSGSAVANIGHGNKAIADVAKSQAETIAYTHLSRFTSDPIETCAKKVSELAPEGLNHVYFVSGGSEATETAIKMCRQYHLEKNPDSTKWKVISKQHSFHGNTLGSLSMTGITERRQQYDPMLINFPKIPQFYQYRNPWHSNWYETSINAALALESEIQFQGKNNIAAFISEPVIGSAAPGVYPHPIYFKMVREICNKYDVLFIMDEVMTGFGRTGKMFACEHFDVTPDLMCIAKGMSAGYAPIGAVIASDKVFNTIMISGSGSFKHGHTYGGHPLSCAIASKVIDIVSDGLVENAYKRGKQLLHLMNQLKKIDIVGDIRGLGLLIGIEFVCDKNSKKPYENSYNVKQLITENCLKEGLVVYPGSGTYGHTKGDHILIAPPLIITKEETKKLYEKLEKAILKTNQMLRKDLPWKNLLLPSHRQAMFQQNR